MKPGRIIVLGLLWALVLLVPRVASAQFSPGKLSAAHAEYDGLNKCTECHSLGRAINEQKCKDCHTEITDLIDAGRGYHASDEVQEKGCVDCHSEHHGREFDAMNLDTNAFDHLLTGYELVGGHEPIDCRDCHKPEYILDTALAAREDTYIGLVEDCLSCHNDYHRETLPEDCLSCHAMEEWTPAELFNHDSTEYPLIGAHRDVECIECHAKTTIEGEDFQEFSLEQFDACIDCHEDQHNGRLGTDCLECHSIFSWSIADNKGFDHNKTRYPLEGLHQDVACEECHENGFKAMPFERCTDCHEDYHNGDFERENGTVEDCNSCHSVDWEFTYSTYDLARHNESQYPLEGAHGATPCTECHKDNEEEWDFSLEDQSCVACHTNEHKGFMDERYTKGNGCADCHNTTRWEQVTFDHEAPSFKLYGAHETTTCRECHYKIDEVSGLEQQEFIGLAHSCVSCHEDEHSGQFLRKNELEVDCARCHNEDSWEIEAFNHDDTEFPLDGQHDKAECSACHKPEEVNGIADVVLYKIEEFECIDCHGT